MSVRTPGTRDLSPLTEDMVAAYLRARGDVAVPDGFLAAARAEALRPVAIRRTRPLMAGLAVAVAVVLLAVVALTLPARQAPITPVATPPVTPVAPVRELLLATYRDSADGGEVLLRPADPATALPLEGFDPIAIAQPFEPHLSPDGRTLAIMTWLSDAPGTGTLRLIDLASWTITDTPVTGLVDFRGVTWTPDSGALVWFAPTETSPTVPVGRAFEVMRWAIGTPAAEHLLQLPDPALRPLSARILVDPTRASTLVVQGELTDRSGAETGVAHVLRIDLDQPRVLGDVELSGLDLAQGATSPAVVWDLPRGRLFVATLDHLATVGLPGLEVTTLPIGSAIGAEGPSPTIAAEVTGSVPRAFLSGAIGRDGERLYVTGFTQSPRDSYLAYVPQPVGLRMVDTVDGALAAPADPSVGQLALRPTSDRMVLVGWTARTPGDGTSSIRVVVPASLDLVARVPPIEGATTPYPVELATSWDGRYGYLVANVQTDDGGHTETMVIDLADGRIVSRSQPDPEEPALSLLALGGGS